MPKCVPNLVTAEAFPPDQAVQVSGLETAASPIAEHGGNRAGRLSGARFGL
jgi:hypothetical protein